MLFMKIKFDLFALIFLTKKDCTPFKDGIPSNLTLTLSTHHAWHFRVRNNGSDEFVSQFVKDE